MNSVIKAVLVGFAVSTFSIAANAADTGKESKGAAGSSAKGGSWPAFSKADSDSNGAISMDEARTVGGLSDNFSQHDKNGDGKLSRSEYESAQKGAGKASGAGTGTSSSGAAGSAGGGSAGSSDSKSEKSR